MRFLWSFPLSVSRSLIASAVLFIGLACASASSAQTADGQTPAEEVVCDSLTGALWGLCVAYCEAMDCDFAFPHAADQACDSVLGNYLKKSGGDMPPCEESMDDGGTGDGGEGGGTGDGGEDGGTGDGGGTTE